MVARRWTTDNFSGMLPTVAYFLLIVQPNYGLTRELTID